MEYVAAEGESGPRELKPQKLVPRRRTGSLWGNHTIRSRFQTCHALKQLCHITACSVQLGEQGANGGLEAAMSSAITGCIKMDTVEFALQGADVLSTINLFSLSILVL